MSIRACDSSKRPVAPTLAVRLVAVTCAVLAPLASAAWGQGPIHTSGSGAKVWTAHSDGQIRLPHATPAKKPVTSQAAPTSRHPNVAAGATAVTAGPAPSLVRQAAHGKLLEEAPPESLRRPMVRQAGHLACDCEHCSSGYVTGGVGCGFEPSCGILGPTCGPGVGCGIEPGCGWDPACGIEYGCDVTGCDTGCCDPCAGICPPLFGINWNRFEFFAGVNGFTGPANHASDADTRRGGSGSFGFYEGVNEGRSLDRLLGLDVAGQLGMRATQSSLSGAEFTDNSRKQIFVTGGFFRRVDFGLQYGAVVDYLYDDWWFRNDLTQVRGELSWNNGCGQEIGYNFMIGTQSSTSVTRLLNEAGNIDLGTATFDPLNQHRLFLRGRGIAGGSYQAFAGGTDRGDGLLGIALMSAMRDRFAVQGGVTYLIPNRSHRDGGFADEAWNLSMGIVFRPGGRTYCGRHCRPMFDVADNGTFLLGRR